MTEMDLELQELRRKLKAYEDTGLKPEDVIDLMGSLGNALGIMADYHLIGGNGSIGDIDHIHGLLKAEKDERLVVLPCKLGTRIYKVQNECSRDICRCERCLVGYGYETQCAYWDDKRHTCTNSISLKKNGVYYEIVSRRFSLDMVYNFGKTIFLAREEAEKTLKGGNENA